MFKLMGKDINAILGAQTILIWTYHRLCMSLTWYLAHVPMMLDYKAGRKTLAS